MKKYLVYLLSGVLAVSAVAAEKQVLATVNGQAITESELSQIVNVLSNGQSTLATLNDIQKKQLLEQVIESALLEQEAKKAKFDQSPEVKVAYQNMLVGLWVQDWMRHHEPSEQALRKIYDKEIAGVAGRKEYDVSHILLENEADAQKLLKQLQQKKISFSEAAKQSIDTTSATSGGNLGWSQASDYVPPFAKAVEEAKVGVLVDHLVKSQFGYHIILVNGERPVAPPSFDEVRQELISKFTTDKIFEHVEELKKKAKIQYTK